MPTTPSSPATDAFIRRLAELYQRASADIVSSVAQSSIFSARPAREAALLRQIDAILEQLTGETSEVLEALIADAYKDASSDAIDRIQRETGLSEEELVLSFSLVDQQAVAAIAAQAFEDLQLGIAQTAQSIRRLVMDTQLSAALNAQVRREIGVNIAKGGTRLDVTRRLKQLLADGLMDADLLDEIGGLVDGVQIRIGRAKMPLASYAELVARTMQRDAATAGTVNRMTVNGLDLLEVTVTRGVVDSCRVFEGLIVSISGKTKGFPSMAGLPRGRTPFHPRCTHVMAPRSIEALTEAEMKRKTKIRRRYLGKTWAELERIRRHDFQGSAERMRRHARS